jgi:hypothetical protein
VSTPYAAPTPCWKLHPEYDYYEWIPHYATEAEARADLDPDDDRAPRQEGHRCVTLRCDGCGRYHDQEGELSDTPCFHIDPDEFVTWLDTMDWQETDDRRHFCPDCDLPAGAEPQAWRDTSRDPGPDDVPLFEAVRPCPD